MTLINMKMDAEEAKETTSPSVEDSPLYPWGLQIHLDDKAMEKLGLSDMKAGQEVSIIAKAICSSCSTYQTQGNEMESSCDLQITDMTVNAGSGITGTLYDKGDK